MKLERKRRYVFVVRQIVMFRLSPTVLVPFIADICQLGFFDPMGLLEDAPQERFDRLRYVEVKHGRT
jgi:hypothetical protein